MTTSRPVVGASSGRAHGGVYRAEASSGTLPRPATAARARSGDRHELRETRSRTNDITRRSVAPDSRRSRIGRGRLIPRGYRTVALRAFGASHRVVDPLPRGHSERVAVPAGRESSSRSPLGYRVLTSTFAWMAFGTFGSSGADPFVPIMVVQLLRGVIEMASVVPRPAARPRRLPRTRRRHRRTRVGRAVGRSRRDGHLRRAAAPVPTSER
jgi:hypothetical protein